MADVSHELTTPLAAIRGYVETLGMSNLAIDEATRARYLKIINEETDRLEHIVGDLLDLAKLEGGGATFRNQPVAVSQLFERIHERHDQPTRSKDITLETTIAPDAATVSGDQNRLEQALQNLVANAVRHTPDGGKLTLAAEIVEAENGFAAVFRVKDTGPGIPPEHLPHIFERFYKADAARTASSMSGSGLGLSIVQAIVARHGGTVTAANAPEGGAVFEIRIPRSSRPSSD